ncbi:MAG TPA: NHL repeat-containing protein [Candidatus Acidoferrales bacterium]|nr:NHL repeat-containing protein [Candidatus Acidoferrales bacterium]
MCGCTATQSRQLAAETPTPPPVQYLGKWGNAGGDPGQLGSPRSIAADDLGNVYIADAGAPTPYIHKFTHDGHPLYTFEPITRMTNPCAMAVKPGGAIYVMECHSGALALFMPDGSKLHTIRSVLRLPPKAVATGVTVDDDGRIYIGQSHPTRIVRLATSGRMIGSLSGAKVAESLGEVDQIAAGASGEVFVADAQKRRILRLSAGGQVQSSWSWSAPESTVSGDGVSGAELCALTATSRYVILLTGTQSAPHLQIWASDGAERFSGALPIDSELSLGADSPTLAVTPAGELMILNPAGHQVLRYRINLQ